MGENKHRLATRLIHAGEIEPVHGAITLPVFQSSTFEYSGQTEYDDLKYIRLNNTPNHLVLHAKLASLEGAEAALVTASGMAAISTTLLTLLEQGDHLLAQDCLYGGSFDFMQNDLPRLGISAGFIDGARPETWQAALTPATKLIYVETITNPLMQVIDLEAVVRFAKEHGLVSVIDNTFASPINFRPPEHGFDLSLHSGSKYLNGHSDIVAGAVIGGGELVGRVRHKLNHLGGSMDPHACFLLQRGLMTLAVRMEHQNRASLRLAEYLAGHPRVAKVNHPGLKQSPSHEMAARYLDGWGGMLSFELKDGLVEAQRFMSRARLPFNAPSLGGVESLMTLPATTSHSAMPKQDRLAMGIDDGLVRISVGLEDPVDLIEDFAQALEA